MTTRPPRLRDLESPPSHNRPRGHRKAYVIALICALPVVGLLVYGFVRQSIVQPAVDSTIERSDMVVRAGEQIQVEVVNACGVDGVARRFTEFLRARRFDVAETNTAVRLEARSQVLDRVGDRESARKVAYALGISEAQIRTEVDSTLFLRATVVIGADFKILRPMK